MKLKGEYLQATSVCTLRSAEGSCLKILQCSDNFEHFLKFESLLLRHLHKDNMSETSLEILYGRDMDSKLHRDGKDIKKFQSYHNEMKEEMQFDKKAKT